jgi:DNA-binding NarL/FixJ family response regulator
MYEVAGLAAQGLSNKAIAERMSIKPRTVEDYIERAAKRVPGKGRPKLRLVIWYHTRQRIAA